MLEQVLSVTCGVLLAEIIKGILGKSSCKIQIIVGDKSKKLKCGDSE